MATIRDLNAEHIDILKEIGNIGAGNAATALSQLLNKKIEMNVPNVQIVTFDEVMELVGGAEQVVAAVFLRIEGEAPGSMFFVLSLPQAERFVKQMTGDALFSLTSPQPSELGISALQELGISALQELGNILAGSYLSALADFTKLTLYPSVPALTVDMIGAILQYGLLELSRVGDYAIVIDTAVHEEQQPGDSINGHFFLLPDPDSFVPIFRSLGVSYE